jgi:hypothetical protein
VDGPQRISGEAESTSPETTQTLSLSSVDRDRRRLWRLGVGTVECVAEQGAMFPSLARVQVLDPKPRYVRLKHM